MHDLILCFVQVIVIYKCHSSSLIFIGKTKKENTFSEHLREPIIRKGVFFFSRAAENRTRSLRTRSACTTGILRPVVDEQELHYSNLFPRKNSNA